MNTATATATHRLRHHLSVAILGGALLSTAACGNGGTSSSADRPPTTATTTCAVADDGSQAATVLRGLCDRLSDPMSNAEHLDVFAGFAGAATVTSLGSLPMAVITAVDRQLPAGLSAAEVVRLTDVWDEGQRSWSHLSTSSRLVPVDDTSHDIQLDHPDVVIDEIVRLLP